MRRFADVLGRSRIAQNALALYAYQVALTLLPLITLPVIARALGPSELADVVLAQSASFVLGIVMAYGFEFSGTRDVSRVRDDREALADVLAAIHGAKLVLAAISVACAVAMTLALEQFRADPWLAVFALGLALLYGAQPIWFLTGLERVRASAVIDVVVLVFNAAAIVLLVRDRDDGHIVLAVLTAGGFVTTGAKLVLARRFADLRVPRVRAGLTQLRRGGHLFLSTVGQSLFTVGNVFLLGFLAPGAQLAFFASAERVVRAGSRFVPPIAFAVFPQVNRLIASGEHQRAQRLAAITLVVLAGLGVAAAAVLEALAEPIVVLIFGEAFRPAIELLRILVLVIPLGAISTALSTQFLMPRGLDATVSRCVLAAALINVVLAVLIVPGQGVEAMAWILVGVEAFLVVVFASLLLGRGGAAAR